MGKGCLDDELIQYATMPGDAASMQLTRSTQGHAGTANAGSQPAVLAFARSRPVWFNGSLEWGLHAEETCDRESVPRASCHHRCVEKTGARGIARNRADRRRGAAAQSHRGLGVCARAFELQVDPANPAGRESGYQ